MIPLGKGKRFRSRSQLSVISRLVSPNDHYQSPTDGWTVTDRNNRRFSPNIKTVNRFSKKFSTWQILLLFLLLLRACYSWMRHGPLHYSRNVYIRLRSSVGYSIDYYNKDNKIFSSFSQNLSKFLHSMNNSSSHS